MLKIFSKSRCTLYTTYYSQATFKMKNTSNHIYSGIIRSEQDKKFKDKTSTQVARSKILLSRDDENIKGVNEVLKKYKIEGAVSDEEKVLLYSETPFTVEKRIMLFEEFGVRQISISLIINFVNALYLPMNLYKAACQLDPNVNIAENIFSHIGSSKVKIQDLKSHLNENMSMRAYYCTCFNYFVQKELELNDQQAKRVSNRKHNTLIYNSFRLLERLFGQLKKELNITTKLILRNYNWLLAHHPQQTEGIVNLLDTHFKDLPLQILPKYPKLLECNITDLKKLLLYFNHYGITTKMVERKHTIFHLSSTEFKNRMEFLLSNPYTLFFQKHSRFLTLVCEFPVILNRIRYLEENNLRYASIHSLTTFHNHKLQLVTKRKQTTLNLISFFSTQFNDDAEDLLKQIKRHAYYSFVPLINMYETLNYLKKTFPIESIHRHIYAILYNKDDICRVYTTLSSDPSFNHLTPSDLLSLCIYELEKKCHFTGEGVLADETDSNVKKTSHFGQ